MSVLNTGLLSKITKNSRQIFLSHTFDSTYSYSELLHLQRNNISIISDFSVAPQDPIAVFIQYRHKGVGFSEPQRLCIIPAEQESIVTAKVQGTEFRLSFLVTNADLNVCTSNSIVITDYPSDNPFQKTKKYNERATVQLNEIDLLSDLPSSLWKEVYNYITISNKSKYNPIRFKVNDVTCDVNPLEEIALNISGMDVDTISYQAHFGGADFTLVASKNPLHNRYQSGITPEYLTKYVGGAKLLAPHPTDHNKWFGYQFNDLYTLKLYDLTDVDYRASAILNTGGIVITDLKTFTSTIADCWVTSQNSLLVFLGEDRGDSINEGLWKSTDFGETWTEIIAPNTYNYLAGSGIDENDGTIVFAEYTLNDNCNVYRSDDDGDTWTSVLSVTTPTVRHFHRVEPDRYKRIDPIWYITTGDVGDQVRWYKSTDDALTFTEITETIGLDEEMKEAGFLVLPDHIIWGTDGEGMNNVIWKAEKDDLISSRKATYSDYGIIWIHEKVGDTIWATVTKQNNPNDRNFYPNIQRIIYSRDFGETWHVLTEYRGTDVAISGWKISSQPNDIEAFALYTTKSVEGGSNTDSLVVIPRN